MKTRSTTALTGTLLLALGLSACASASTPDATSTPTPTATSASAAEQACAAADDLGAALTNARDNLSSVRSRADLTALTDPISESYSAFRAALGTAAADRAPAVEDAWAAFASTLSAPSGDAGLVERLTSIRSALDGVTESAREALQPLGCDLPNG